MQSVTTIAIIGFAAATQAFPSFRAQRQSSMQEKSDNTMFHMQHHTSPAVFDASPLFRFEDESSVGIQNDAKASTSAPGGESSVGIQDDAKASTNAPGGIVDDSDDDESTTTAGTDEDITTGPNDDDETTTVAPDDEEIVDSEAFILSEDSQWKRRAQAEDVDVDVVGILPPLPPALPGLPVVPPVVIVDVDTGSDISDDEDNVVTTEAPEEVTTADPDTDDEEATPEPEPVTVLPGGPFQPIIDIIRPTARPSTTEPVGVVTTRRPRFPFTTSTVPPTTTTTTTEEPSEEPTPSGEDSEQGFLRFLPSWMRPSAE